MAGKLANYNLKVDMENIDAVVHKLLEISNIEIRTIMRTSGMIRIKAFTLENLTSINEILNIEKDNKFYFNRIALI